VFSSLARSAKAWIAAPSPEGLSALEARARELSARVPEGRRADWEKLVAGFATREDDPRRRARVEGLVRACRLFAREQRADERLALPLAWSDPVERVDGLGPTSAEKLAKHGVRYVGDLVWTLPSGWDDLRAPVGVREAVERARAAEAALQPAPRQCVRARVQGARFVPMRGRRVVRVVLGDGEAAAAVAGGARQDTIEAWWFYAAHGVLGAAKPGTECLVLGRVRTTGGKRPRLAHPELIVQEAQMSGLRSRYPSFGVAPGLLRRSIRDVLARVTTLPDPVPVAIAAREGMPPAEALLRAVHGDVDASLDGRSPAMPEPGRNLEEARRALAERLAWVEAFALVWQRLRSEAQWGGARAPVLARWDAAAADRLEGELGFSLTGAQRRAIEAVAADLRSSTPMRRLLLGDVGTGKTAVALAAAAQCVASGFQCALLAPTSVLAEQYRSATGPLERATGARAVSLISSMRAAERREVVAAVASGAADVVVGTHAMLEEDVAFARLGLVVVDEQQRFGVAQRLSLVKKGEGRRPHLLSLSATPIPRTLALALRGELAVTVLDEKPKGRVPVRTERVARAELGAVVERVRAACARGERAFFVCPRIEDDEEDEDVGVVAQAEHLARELPGVGVVVVHGAMKPAARLEAMRSFRRGDAQVLVGTTVVEVGVDVPEATLMVIDGAESFGLAQLHQLRGRVGRGDRPGTCLLLHDEPLVDLARQRLETLVSTADGAEIARADLALRGAGDLSGVRQSGDAEELMWLDTAQPPSWVERMGDDVRSVLASDPELRAPEHLALALALRRVVAAIAVREEAG
jgi:ATP-dependent DNA helicase RecG